MYGTDQIQFFETVLFKALGKETEVKDMQFLSGGCINNTVLLKTSSGDFFIKWSEENDEEMFEAEAKGLELLRKADELHIPEVLEHGRVGQRAFLLMEYIRSRPNKSDYWQDFGRKLAALHRHTQSQFGLSHNNFIGSLPQSNEPMDNWVDFFIEKRLNVQLGLARYNELIDEGFVKKVKSIFPKLNEILPEEPPALLHGDLWSGNVMTDEKGEVCLIDPAVYYGHREAELAFTQLFGGFEQAFYKSYQEAYPLQPGFESRRDIYNMYPLLVHVNLFGTSYLSGVKRTMERLI
jgi:protein-ribulosamine 3-kinase